MSPWGHALWHIGSPWGCTPGLKQWGCPSPRELKESVPLLHGAVAGASKHQLLPSWDPTTISAWPRACPSPSQRDLWADVPEH